MSPFLRGTLFGAGIVAALVASYYLGRSSTRTPDVAAPAVSASSSARTEKPVALGPSPSEPTIIQFPIAEAPPLPEPDIVVAGVPVSRSRSSETPDIPKLDLDNLPPPNATDPVSPNDPTLQIIRKQLSIKTTILDNQDPPPSVLTEAKKNLEPMFPQIEIGPMPTMVPKLDMPPPPALCKLVNTRNIAIDFEKTRIGSTPIAAVELWTTLDGGQTWNCTDRMTGCNSPMRTRLGSDSVYGFKLVFENELGLRSFEPKAGDAPDMYAELDLKAPAVSAVNVEAIAGQSGKVRLSWTVADKHEDRRSARLEFSTDGCEWQSIDLAGLRRDGEHCEVEWTVPLGVPSQVQFRVTARDLAGNQTVSESPNKMTIDLVVPEGKVTGVRSDRAEPEIGPMPRVIGIPSASRQFPNSSRRAYGERQLIDILLDRDWKPTTATPESYRLWEYKPNDSFWGLPSGIEFIY